MADIADNAPGFDLDGWCRDRDDHLRADREARLQREARQQNAPRWRELGFAVENDEATLPSVETIIATVKARTEPTGARALAAVEAIDPKLASLDEPKKALVRAALASVLDAAHAPDARLRELAAVGRRTARVKLDDENALAACVAESVDRLREIARLDKESDLATNPPTLWRDTQVDRELAWLRERSEAFEAVTVAQIAALLGKNMKKLAFVNDLLALAGFQPAESSTIAKRIQRAHQNSDK